MRGRHRQSSTTSPGTRPHSRMFRVTSVEALLSARVTVERSRPTASRLRPWRTNCTSGAPVRCGDALGGGCCRARRWPQATQPFRQGSSELRPPPRDLWNRNVVSGAGPDALTHPLDVDLGFCRANEHRPDFVPFPGCCAYDPGPRTSRIRSLEAEVLSLFEVPLDRAVHDPAGFALVPGVVSVTEVLGDCVEVAGGLRQLVQCCLHQAVLPAPLPPRPGCLLRMATVGSP